MAWDHLSITKAHLVYIILGGFTSLFMLCSSIIKERMYIGEATVATLCGVIFGPHAANLIDPASWGNVDLITLEFSRIVLVVQCFAVGVELPKFYMERHWKSVSFLLIPVMTFGWLIVSLVIWWMVPTLNWLESLVVAACVTATDPVLASSVVGKGKFAKRVPKHLRDLLSAESGCNDGMAFPFVYLGIYLIQEHMDARKTVFHWMVFTILYECFFGALYGFTLGYIARHAIKFAERRDLIDRESFLVFYFVLALFCAGSGSLLGLDDLLIGFAAGVGFSNDGWFHAKTEESHVSNVIDLLINLAYFVYLGTIIPWEQFNNVAEGLTAWRLVVLSIFVLLFRRMPAMLLLKPFIPDIKTWREAFFAGHFGPIGVGAIFVAILARAELAYETAVPLADTPPQGVPHYTLIALIWPIVTFLVITSIIVHGSSIAVFTLGKRINTLNLTMSYTTSPEDGPSWLNRLPRISSQSKSQARSVSETSQNEKMPDFPPGTLPPIGAPGHFLRRQKDSDDDGASKYSVRPISRDRKRRKSRERMMGVGGPVSQSAIFPTNRASTEPLPGIEKGEQGDGSGTASGSSHTAAGDNGSTEGTGNDGYEKRTYAAPPRERAPELQIYDEGGNLVVETQDGEVLALEKTPTKEKQDRHEAPGAVLEKTESKKAAGDSGWTSFKRAVGDAYSQEMQKRKEKTYKDKRHEPARAFQFGNTVSCDHQPILTPETNVLQIVIEDEDGEVIRKYDLSDRDVENEGPDLLQKCQRYLGLGGAGESSTAGAAGPSSGVQSDATPATKVSSKTGWASSLLGSGAQKQKKTASEEGAGDATADVDDDKKLRFTIGDKGQRMTKEDFIREVRRMDPKARREVVETLERGPLPPTDEAAERNEGAEVGKTVGRTQPMTKANDYDDDAEETPAERRRREAALGVSGSSQAGVARGSDGANASGDEDSDDEGTPRVPPSRRGIRFADDLETERGRHR